MPVNVNESRVLLFTVTELADDDVPLVPVDVELVDDDDDVDVVVVSITAIDFRRVTSRRALFSVASSAVRSALLLLAGDASIQRITQMT